MRRKFLFTPSKRLKFDTRQPSNAKENNSRTSMPQALTPDTTVEVLSNDIGYELFFFSFFPFRCDKLKKGGREVVVVVVLLIVFNVAVSRTFVELRAIDQCRSRTDICHGLSVILQNCVAIACISFCSFQVMKHCFIAPSL